MKNVNALIKDYTQRLQQGDLQIAYREILNFMSVLRTELIKRNPQYDAGSLYQGVMDMTYFALSTPSLKEKGLKISVVYLHEKGRFEVWLSARNRSIAKSFASILGNHASQDLDLFHDLENLDAIVECVLSSTPDFDEQKALIDVIDGNLKKFIVNITETGLL